MQGYAISTAELRLKATHLARQSDTMANFRGSIPFVVIVVADGKSNVIGI
jgi:uncharacterized membrane protein